jgi:hypothetical protein
MIKKDKSKKLAYVSESSEDNIDKAIKDTEALLKSIKPDYLELFKKIGKSSLQARIFTTEVFIQSFISDCRLPYPNAIHILEKTKFNLLKNESILNMNTIPSKKEISYVG